MKQREMQVVEKIERMLSWHKMQEGLPTATADIQQEGQSMEKETNRLRQ